MSPQSDRKQEQMDRFVADLQDQILEQARETYTATVVDHWMHPRNLRTMDDADGHARVTGSCGDSTEVFVRVRDGHIVEASFQTDGCGTTIAAASMAVELATGRTPEEALWIGDEEILEALGGLPEESEHCATLAANALRAAVEACGTRSSF